MNLARKLKAATDPLMQRIRRLVSFAPVTRADAAPKLQQVQVDAGGDPTDDLDHWEPFGLTGHPKTDGKAEALVINLGGEQDGEVVIAVADRRYRVTGLAEGDVAVYDAHGQSVRLTASAIVIDAATKIELGSGASAAVARVGDQTFSNATYDSVFWTWVTNVATATSTTAPTQLIGRVNSGSAVVKAVD